MDKWERKEKIGQEQHSFFEALKDDIFDGRYRYKYREELFRNFPGQIGIWLRTVFWSSAFKSIGKNVTFWPGVRIKHPQNIILGNNVQIGYDNHYQATKGIIIGDDTIIGPDVNIWTMNHVYSDLNKPIKDQGYEKKSVIIGRNCWITSKCFILPGAKIPDGCVILPGSVVGIIKIPKNSVVGGNPAKVRCFRESIGKFRKYD